MRNINYNSSMILTHIIKRCYLYDYPINQAQAQRLLYCCYGSVLALFNMRLTDERPITWESGVIFPRALFEHMHHQLNFAENMDFIDSPHCSPAIRYVINQTIDNFAILDAQKLQRFLNKRDSPWCIDSYYGENLGVIIDDDLVHDFFLKYVVNPLAYDGPSMEIKIKETPEVPTNLWG